MATVNLIKAVPRSRGGKGAARAERRAGRVPGIIYGDGKPPLPISLDYNDLRQRIYAGHFLTTIHDVEIDGVKHRVIPRDFQLDAIRDLPLHVDFMRLGEGATIRVNIPIHVKNADQSPGVKRGGTVSIVAHTIEVRCRGRRHSGQHRSRCRRARHQLLQASERHHAAGRRARGRRPRHHLGHGGAAIGLCGRNESRGRSRCCRALLRRPPLPPPVRRRPALRVLLRAPLRCCAWRRRRGAAPAAGAAEKK